MKTTMMICVPLTLVLLAGSALAGFDGRADKVHGGRHGGPHEFDAAKRVERMTEELDLSAEQGEQLLAVFEAADTKREALRKQIEEQFKPAMCAQQLATAEQVREILTDEQEAEFEDRLERMADLAEGKGRRGPRGAFLEDCEPLD
jgi:Spy/CpxP family protein refolding chaperone